MTKARLILFITFLFIGACQRFYANQPDGFEIAAHDVSTGQYTILDRSRESNGRYVISKIVALCKMYHLENQPPVNGADACDLKVGRIYRTNIMDDRRAKGEPDMYVEILPGGGAISIQEGSGKDKASNFLSIVSQTVTSDAPQTD